MRIIPRAEWGARYRNGFGPAPLPAREVWLHHSVTIAPDLVAPFDDDDEAVRSLERIGEGRFGGGISYTFLVTPSGRVYQGHTVDREGAHTSGHNSVGRAICLVGNYENDAPTPAMVDAVVWLLQTGHVAGWWTAPRLAGGHRDLKATACPGARAYALIPTINARAMQEDDMPSAQEIADAILDTPIPRLGDDLPPNLVGGTTSLRNEVAWMTNSVLNGAWSWGAGARVADQVEAMTRSGAGLLDPEDLRRLVRAGVSDAIGRVLQVQVAIPDVPATDGGTRP